MSTQVILSLIGGLLLLVAGGEALVRGATRLAAALGISPLVIGLTVVAFGTSAPELAVSVQAGLGGNPEIALANVIGSNIFNVLLVGGVCALILPLAVNQQLVRMDVPIMIGTSIVAFTMALDGQIGRIDGLVLFAGVIGYTVYGIRTSRVESSAVKAEYAEEFGAQSTDTAPSRLTFNLLLVVAGVIVLVIGSRLLVSGAAALATALGVSQTVIGLTIVAGGTSLPELVASLVATARRERDIAVGNLVGSSIFNILAILGASGLIIPGGVLAEQSVVSSDMLLMIGVAIACLPIFFSGTITRWEGALFVVCYIVYSVHLVLEATANPRLDAFEQLLLTYGLPLVAVVVLLSGWSALTRVGAPASAQ